jgi:preprotein translocase subunit YajC
MKNIWIIAQTDTGQGVDSIKSESLDAVEQTESGSKQDSSTGGPADEPKERQQGIPHMQIIVMGAMFVLMYFVIFRGPKKKQKQHKQMIQSLDKNDRVRTIGGIIGTVIDVKDDEVVLKVDESNNTKIRVSASAIGKNLSKDNE